jgi:hypothetical protein
MLDKLSIEYTLKKNIVTILLWSVQYFRNVTLYYIYASPIFGPSVCEAKIVLPFVFSNLP